MRDILGDGFPRVNPEHRGRTIAAAFVKDADRETRTPRFDKRGHRASRPLDGSMLRCHIAPGLLADGMAGR